MKKTSGPNVKNVFWRTKKYKAGTRYQTWTKIRSNADVYVCMGSELCCETFPGRREAYEETCEKIRAFHGS